MAVPINGIVPAATTTADWVANQINVAMQTASNSRFAVQARSGDQIGAGVAFRVLAHGRNFEFRYANQLGIVPPDDPVNGIFYIPFNPGIPTANPVVRRRRRPRWRSGS